ncbi:hypothetical protein C8R43DRAFT_78057 [Mycena crocata]|nr:hypothetical protein C8R43DRAFT_78057 [Mycena crocata]
MLQWGGFSAWIEIEGHAPGEYVIDTFQDHNRTTIVTCWITSEAGKSFSVGWRNTSFQASTAGHVFMDGNECGGRVLQAPSGACARLHGLQDSTSIRPFMFSPLTVTDDDAFLGDQSSRHPKLGLVELAIYPVQVLGFIPMAIAAKTLADIKVHERMKSSVTQQIKLAEPQTFITQTALASRFVGPPLVIFSFKYRQLEILQALGIVPRPVPIQPPPPPQLKRKPSVELQRESTPDSDVSDASDTEEIRALREKLNALEARRAKKKGKEVRVKEEENIPPIIGASRKKTRLDVGRFGAKID